MKNSLLNYVIYVAQFLQIKKYGNMIFIEFLDIQMLHKNYNVAKILVYDMTAAKNVCPVPQTRA